VLRHKEHSLSGNNTGISGSSPIQNIGWFSRPQLIVLIWVAVAIAVVVMAHAAPNGQDAGVYWKAIQSLRHGSDPYAESIAALHAYHDQLALNAKSHLPYTYAYPYVYSPVTLPLLRMLEVFPGWLLGAIYAAAVATGVLLQLWAGFQMADKDERRWLALVLPAILFFPGLIINRVILAGNIAYILYGVILGAAVPGWKRNRWFWYYITLLFASIFKVPFLMLLAFPVLVGRRQWIPSCVTAGMGALIFAAQSRLWPDMFHEWLLTLRLLFDWQQDSGYAPAGMLGRTLWSYGLPYSPVTPILHVVFACMLGIVLLLFARRVREVNLPQETWIPVALVGTLLLNPRLMKYDLAAITVPMLLIGWRTLRLALNRSSGGRPTGRDTGSWPKSSDRTAIFVGAGCLLISNAITVTAPRWSDVPVKFAVLLVIFAMGVWSLERLCIELRPRT
jgi:hypothetical protein